VQKVRGNRKKVQQHPQVPIRRPIVDHGRNLLRNRKRLLHPDRGVRTVVNQDALAAASFMLIAQDFPASSSKYQTIRIPRLSPIVRGVIDRPGFSFAAYMAKQSGGPTEVHSWTAEIFGEFRELELQLLAGQLEASLRGSGKDKVRQIG
jgi:hypothetical protein